MCALEYTVCMLLLCMPHCSISFQACNHAELHSVYTMYTALELECHVAESEKLGMGPRNETVAEA